MQKQIALFLALVIAPFAAHAAAPQWTIDAAHSSISFDSLQSGQKFTGGFKKFTGDIVFDPTHLDQSHATITVDVTSITVGGDGDQYVGAPEWFKWFNSAKFPTAKFDASKFEKTATGFIAHGNLTIRDVTLPVDLPFTLTFSPDGKTATMAGGVTLKRLDYHLGTGSWADPKSVAIDVPVRVNVVAAR